MTPRASNTYIIEAGHGVELDISNNTNMPGYGYSVGEKSIIVYTDNYSEEESTYHETNVSSEYYLFSGYELFVIGFISCLFSLSLGLCFYTFYSTWAEYICNNRLLKKKIFYHFLC